MSDHAMNQPSSISVNDAHPTPAGYLRLTVKGRLAVACDWAAPAISSLLSDGTLHDWAAAQKDHDPLHGRGINYGVILLAGIQPESSTAVVVRRNRHGGLLRAITGELFSKPTRAPLELANALRLASSGVNTPEVIAYAIYPVFMNLVQCDVVTRRLPEGGDFPNIWRQADSSTREALISAVARLLLDLSRAGACHADLNLKNIYISGSGADTTPYLLDVDRVTFPDCNDISNRNFKRLARSARKWRDKWGLDFDDNSLERLETLALERH